MCGCVCLLACRLAPPWTRLTHVARARACPALRTAFCTADVFMPVFMMYMPIHSFCTIVAILFMALPPRWALGAVMAFLIPYYGTTLHGWPAHTGGVRPRPAGPCAAGVWGAPPPPTPRYLAGR